jgi:hypothetical protein
MFEQMTVSKHHDELPGIVVEYEVVVGGVLSKVKYVEQLSRSKWAVHDVMASSQILD